MLGGGARAWAVARLDLHAPRDEGARRRRAEDARVEADAALQRVGGEHGAERKSGSGREASCARGRSPYCRRTAVGGEPCAAQSIQAAGDAAAAAGCVRARAERRQRRLLLRQRLPITAACEARGSPRAAPPTCTAARVAGAIVASVTPSGSASGMPAASSTYAVTPTLQTSDAGPYGFRSARGPRKASTSGAAYSGEPATPRRPEVGGTMAA
eukprot:4847419-Prymnesium_polylepis.1